MNTAILSLLLNIFDHTNSLMNRTVFKIFILVFAIVTKSYGQDAASLWQGHFSYNNIVDIVSGENKIYAAADNNNSRRTFW